MYLSHWNRIWDEKAQDFLDHQTQTPTQNFNQLTLNGFNHGPNSILTLESFEEYCAFISKEMMLDSKSYLYEFGCGSGYFLNSLAKTCGSSKFSGSDSSEKMIMVAKSNFLNHIFSVDSADNFRVPDLGENLNILANSVFQYFPDLDYAKRVMLNVKLNNPKRFAFLDVPIGNSAGYRTNRKGASKSLDLYHIAYTPGFFKEFWSDSRYSIMFKRQEIKGYNQSVDRICIFGKRIEE
jgi:SAM-dependent methyltransferase